MAQKKSESAPVLSHSQLVQREEDRQPVRGKFIFHEVPGGRMEFPFRIWYGDEITTYRMDDGEVYTIPYGVAKHLNSNCWYPSWKYKSDEQGRPSVTIGQKIRRCSFQSLEFVDLKGVKPIGSSVSGIETVQE